MQVAPDYFETVSQQEFATCFCTPFVGPGLYLIKTDTLVVVPSPTASEGEVTADNVWHVVQPKSTKLYVAVYNCQWRDTIFSVISRAPVRLDTRS